MYSMILAAGRGTRLASLGLAVPKILVDIGGEPLLARQLRYLNEQGATRIVVNAHHLGDQIEAFAAAWRGGPPIEVVVEERLLGTAGGVRNALDRLGGQPFVVLYGDVVVDEPLAPMLAAHAAARAVATLAVYAAEETVGKGVVEVGTDDLVTGFIEKSHGGGPGLVNAGLYVIDADLVAPLPGGVELDFGHDVLPAAVAAGQRLLAYRLPSPVLDVGTPATLRAAQGAS